MNKNQKNLDFSIGNLVVMLSAVFVVIGVLWFKFGNTINLSDLFTKSQVKGATTVSYDSLLAQVQSESTNEDYDFNDLDSVRQLDPTQAGDVLGASTDEILELPSIDEFLSTPEIKNLKLNLVSDNKNSRFDYLSNLDALEISASAIKLITKLASKSDAITISNQDSLNLMQGLASIKVPNNPEYIKLHKLKIAYYFAMTEIANFNNTTDTQTKEFMTTTLLMLLENSESLSSALKARDFVFK